MCGSKMKVSNARVTMLVVRQLHDMGIPIYAQCQQHPSGMWWRLSLEYGATRLLYSDSEGSNYFGVKSWIFDLTPHEIAKRLATKYNMQPRKPTIKETLFMRWYERALDTICFSDVLVELADWYEKPKFVQVYCSSRIEHKVPFFEDVMYMYSSQKTIHPFLEPFSIEAEELQTRNPNISTPTTVTTSLDDLT